MTQALYFSVTLCYWDQLKPVLLEPNNMKGRHTQTPIICTTCIHLKYLGRILMLVYDIGIL